MAKWIRIEKFGERPNEIIDVYINLSHINMIEISDDNIKFNDVLLSQFNKEFEKDECLDFEGLIKEVTDLIGKDKE